MFQNQIKLKLIESDIKEDWQMIPQQEDETRFWKQLHNRLSYSVDGCEPVHILSWKCCVVLERPRLVMESLMVSSTPCWSWVSTVSPESPRCSRVPHGGPELSEGRWHWSTLTESLAHS
jgi:hypothetical protein